MKKKILTMLIALAVSVGGLCACSGDKNGIEPDVAKIREDIIASVEFPEMVDSTDKDFNYLYELNSADFESFVSSRAGSGGDADEITIVKVKDEKDTADVKTAFDKRIESQKRSYEGYAPIEFEQLQNAVVKVKGKYVILVVSEDSSKAEKIFDDAFKS